MKKFSIPIFLVIQFFLQNCITNRYYHGQIDYIEPVKNDEEYEKKPLLVPSECNAPLLGNALKGSKAESLQNTTIILNTKLLDKTKCYSMHGIKK